MNPHMETIVAGENLAAFVSIALDVSTGKWFRSHILSPPFRTEAVTINAINQDEEGSVLIDGSANIFLTGNTLRNGYQISVDRTTSALFSTNGIFVDDAGPMIGYIYNDSAVSDENGILMIDNRIRSFRFHDFHPSTRTISAEVPFFDALIDGQASAKLRCGLRIPSGLRRVSFNTPPNIGIVIHYSAIVTSGNARVDFGWTIARNGAVWNTTSSPESITGTNTGQTIPAPASANMKKNRGFAIDVTVVGYQALTSGAEMWLTLNRLGTDVNDTMAGTLLISGVDLYL